MEVFEGENMRTQYNLLGYKIDLYLHDYRLAQQIDEKVHKDRNINHEIEKTKSIREKIKM